MVLSRDCHFALRASRNDNYYITKQSKPPATRTQTKTLTNNNKKLYSRYMPTLITHTFIACTGCSFLTKAKNKYRLYFLSILASIIPDFDIIGFYFGVNYGDVLGHRGFSHSIIFALLIGLLFPKIFDKKIIFFSKPWTKLFIFFSLVTMSHGILDAITNGGLGIAFFSPFSNQRFFFPWTPLEVSPIGLVNFIEYGGMQTLASEFLIIGIPLILIYGFRKILKYIKN